MSRSELSHLLKDAHRAEGCCWTNRLLWESNHGLVVDETPEPLSRGFNRPHQLFHLFPCFVRQIHFIDASPHAVGNCVRSHTSLISVSIPSFEPCSVFYYLHYLNWQVVQQRHLCNQVSIISPSACNPDMTHSQTGHHDENGKQNVCLTSSS